MQKFRRAALLAALMTLVGVSNARPVVRGRMGSERITAPSNSSSVIACRVLDAWTVKRMDVGIAVFHQAHEADGRALGEWLHRQDGGTVQFQTPDGKWRAATVLRAGSCFGRGILVYPAATASLAKRAVIQVRFRLKP